MATSQIWRRLRLPARHSIFLGLLAVISTLLTMGVMLIPQTLGTTLLPLAEGDVTSQDILAPFAESFESETLTEIRRQEAADAIEPVYDLPDANIARTQIDRLRSALAFVASVRADDLASTEQQLDDLAALQDINLSEDSATALLNLSDAGWQNVQAEAISVLEQIMRTPIRDDRLNEARSSVPNLVSLSLPEDQAQLVIEFVSGFTAANSLYDEAATEAAKETARQAEPSVIVAYKTNETIVRRGQVITAADLEALEAFGLVQPQIRWQDQLGVFSLVAVSILLMAIFLRYRPDLTGDSRGLTIIAILFILFLVSARLTIPGRTVIPYIFPIAGFSLVVTALFSSQVAIIAALPLGALAAYELPNALDLTLYYILGSIIGALVMKRAQRIATYFWAGAATAGAGALLIIAYRLPEAGFDLIGLATLIGASMVNGFFSGSLTIILQFFLAPTLGLTTTLQLHEISRPDHPLLQFILRNAPGTYQHSLQIANLSEQAAELIGAKALLTRVGALYHDAGKARYPQFFIENQVPESPNPHDELSPTESAAVILRHVPDGLDLAKKHRLPRRIRDFIAEHHGTTMTRYQYAKAIEAADGDKSKVEQADFRYMGPRPQSRETALVMLADGCEARTRAERPKTREELTILVKSMFDTRIAAGQLDDTGITMRDLSIIAESFINTLRGIYHPRIMYPNFDEKTKPVKEVIEMAQDEGESPAKTSQPG
ncbi:MAG: HDIG domain-containing protein [Chloroflexi bacterium]|nr:HDIG domain-containing protein [Chloroflexota bacterium]